MPLSKFLQYPPNFLVEFLKREFSYGSYKLFTHSFSEGRATTPYRFHQTCITTFRTNPKFAADNPLAVRFDYVSAA